MLVSKFGERDNKKSKFNKVKGASWLLSSWKIKARLSKIPLVCPHLY